MELVHRETNRPLVSVIVPVLNAARFLNQALTSVETQTYTPIEIIVIDGPSTDNTAEIAKSFASVRYARQSGVGMWNALNEGLTLARGEFIAMISSDDIWLADKIQMQVDYLRAHPAIQYVLGLTKFVLIDGETPPRAFRVELLQGTHAALLPEAILARKSLYARTGKFDESFAITADVEWLARLTAAHEPYAVLPHVLLHKRIHANNLSTSPRAAPVHNHELLAIMRNQMRRYRAEEQT